MADEIEADGHHCPSCGEPRPHFRDGMCELCWIETEQKRPRRGPSILAFVTDEQAEKMLAEWREDEKRAAHTQAGAGEDK